jgi:hypothetical protein
MMFVLSPFDAHPLARTSKYKMKRMIRMLEQKVRNEAMVSVGGTIPKEKILDRKTLTQDELGKVMIMINRINKYDEEEADVYLDAMDNPTTSPKTVYDLYVTMMWCIQIYEA